MPKNKNTDYSELLEACKIAEEVIGRVLYEVGWPAEDRGEHSAHDALDALRMAIAKANGED